MIFRWYFGFPKFSEVTIFHHEDYWLRRILFKNTKTIVTIPALPYFPVFLSFSFLFFFLKEFLKNKKKITKKSLLKKIYYIYIISVFDYSKTKIIVTFIDNSGIFHNLNNIDLNKKRKYFAIQNGTRHKSCAKFSLPKNYRINLKNFFCFGPRDVKLFTKYKHNIQNFIPIGNIKSSFFFKKNLKSKKIFDICLVSQWRHRFKINDYKNEIEKKVFFHNKNSINILNLYLKKIALLNNYKVAVCLRSKNDFEEIEYYKKVLNGVDYVLVKSDKKKFSTFKTILKSNLTIGLNSTTLAEVFGIRKVLWVNILNNINFEMPEAGISYFNQKNFIKFKNRVEYLIRMNINNYKKLVKRNADYICLKNNNKPAHKIIGDKIKEELNNV